MEGIALSVVKACDLYLCLLSQTPSKAVRLALIKLLARVPGAGNGQGLERALLYAGWMIESLKPARADFPAEGGGSAEGGAEGGGGDKPAGEEGADGGATEVQIIDAVGERGFFDVGVAAGPDSAFVKFAQPFLQVCCTESIPTVLIFPTEFIPTVLTFLLHSLLIFLIFLTETRSYCSDILY